jgi:hypothetical protein
MLAIPQLSVLPLFTFAGVIEPTPLLRFNVYVLQIVTGFSLSVTTIVCVQVDELLWISIAVQVTVVVPTGYTAFNAALSLRTPAILATAQLSVAVAVPMFTL